MSIDDRITRAREELDMLFADLDVPDAAAVPRRHRRRRAMRGAAATLAAVAAVVAVVSAIGARDGDPDRTNVATDPTTTTVAQPPTTTQPVTPTTVRTVTPDSLTDPGAAGPDTIVAVRADGALVRIDLRGGGVSSDGLPRLDDPTAPRPAEGEPRYIVGVQLASDGTIFYDECCEPAYGMVRAVGRTPDAGDPVGNVAAVSPDGRYLAFVNDRVVVRDLTTNADVRQIEIGRPSRPHGLSWASAGALAIALGGEDATDSLLYIVSSTATNLEDAIELQAPSAAVYEHPQFLADGRLLFVQQARPAVDETGARTASALMTWAEGEGFATVATGDFGIRDLAVSAQGHVLAVSDDGALLTLVGGEWSELGRGFSAADW